MEALFQLLEGIYPMSSGLKDYIFHNLKQRTLRKRDFLLMKNQVNTVGSFLASGLLHCYYLENDKKITSWFLLENKLAIGVHSFFSQSHSYECIEAMEPCELYYLTYQELQYIYRTYLEFNFIIRVLVEKYYMLKEEHAYQLQKGTTIKDRFDWFMDTFPDVISRVPMRHIASFLGVTEETLSRIRSQKS